jgi:TatD DNase family protein
MTSTHASKRHIDTLPASLRSLYFPQSTKPDNFVHGKPVKGRNEPCAIGGVAWVIHQLNPGIPFEKITEKVWRNTVELFVLHELSDQKEV